MSFKLHFNSPLINMLVIIKSAFNDNLQFNRDAHHQGAVFYQQLLFIVSVFSSN